MKIITISREFGSGGRELGKRLADIMGFDYYDKELITAIAKSKTMDKDYVKTILDHHGWKNFPITYRQSFLSMTSMQSASTALLLEQKVIIEKIAQLKKDCIIIGKNADVILQEYYPLNLFICAEKKAKIRRCLERADENQTLSEKAIEKKMKEIDKNRAKVREIITNSVWGDRSSYHLTINTTNWNIKELALAVTQFANLFFGRDEK